MPVSELEAQQGIINLLEGKLAETEELFSQGLHLLNKMVNEPSEATKTACIEFIKKQTTT